MTHTLSGIVISRHGKEVLLEDSQGQRHRCITRMHLDAVISGDQVDWEPQPQGHGSITAIKPRRSELTAQTKDGKRRIVAANIDYVVIVCSVQPALQPEILDAYLIACESAAIPAIIAFNKIDLLSREQTDATPSELTDYAAIGYPVCFVSVKSGSGVKELQHLLTGKATVLVGQSGVGKSSLIRALVPHADARVGELSAQHGRHTTSHSELYHLPGSGFIIDSPGVRSFQFSPLDATSLAHAFIEFRPWLGQCRFADCSHHHEPGCAIKQAVENHRISLRRYSCYLQLLTTTQVA